MSVLGWGAKLQIWMHLHCFHFALTAVPSLPFHSAKRLMCFPKAALRWDISQTFYAELSDGGSHPDPLSGPYAATYVSQTSFDNANSLCFVLPLSTYQPALYSRGNCLWQVCWLTWSKITPVTGSSTLRKIFFPIEITALPFTNTCTFDLRGSNLVIQTLLSSSSSSSFLPA